MAIYISLIVIYSITVAVSVYLLSTLRLYSDNLSFKAVLDLFFNIFFWLGLFFGLLARVVFVVINSQLSKSTITQNANTSITFIITLSSVIAVVLLNYFLLKERLNLTQIIGTGIIIFGVLLMFKNS